MTNPPTSTTSPPPLTGCLALDPSRKPPGVVPARQLIDLGARQVVDRLQALADRHGPRFEPAPALADAARAGTRFYPGP